MSTQFTLRSRFTTATLLSVATLAMTLPATQSHAIEREWLTSSSVYFDNLAAWTGGVSPSPTDSALFDRGVTHLVAWASATQNNIPSVDALRVISGDVRFINYNTTDRWLLTINGSTPSTSNFQITGPTTKLTVGGLNFQTPGASILDGGTLTLAASGPQTALLGVGTSGLIVDGNFNITQGSDATNTATSYIGSSIGSTGVVTVTDAGSTWTNANYLYVGDAGNGTLDVLDGAAASNTTAILGISSGSTGSATVNGLGSIWTNTGDLTVGSFGQGTLVVAGGGTVSSDGGYVGRSSVIHTSVATVTGAGSAWNNTAGLIVGDSGNGTLNILSGGTVSSTFGEIASSSAISTGVVTVNGTGSQWNNTASLNIGGTGNGTLNIEAGGSVSNVTGSIGQASGSAGVATVTGAGSTWINTGSLFVGRNGGGTLNVQAGGSVSNLTGSIGGNYDSIGVATVTGAGSTWNSQLLLVGNYGNGTLNVEAGGSVNSADAYVGDIPISTGVATVTGPGSTWTNSGGLTIGGLGDGTLNVEAGGSVSSADGFVGEVSGSTGVATVTGVGSSWTNSGGLYVGGNSIGSGGNGTLNIMDGGLVEAGPFTIWGTGTVNLDGGTLSVGSIDKASLANLNFEAGTINITSADLAIGAAGLFGDFLNIQPDQTIIVTNLATVEADGTLAVFGGFSSGGLTNHGNAIFVDTTIGGAVINPTGSNIDVVGNVNFTGLVSGGGGIFGSGTANFQGGFAPGDSPALVTIEGSANLAASNTLTIELAGLTAGTEYDVIDIAGTLDLGGTLDVVFLDGFSASFGDSFTILDAGQINGGFDTINLATLQGDLYWDVEQTSTTFSVTAVPEPTSLAMLAMGGLLLTRRRRAA